MSIITENQEKVRDDFEKERNAYQKEYQHYLTILDSEKKSCQTNLDGKKSQAEQEVTEQYEKLVAMQTSGLTWISYYGIIPSSAYYHTINVRFLS